MPINPETSNERRKMKQAKRIKLGILLLALLGMVWGIVQIPYASAGLMACCDPATDPDCDDGDGGGGGDPSDSMPTEILS